MSTVSVHAANASFLRELADSLPQMAPKVSSPARIALLNKLADAEVAEAAREAAHTQESDEMTDEYIRYVNAKVRDSLANMQRRYSQQEVESIVASWFSSK